MSLSPGDLVDRYRIVARLGAGGMGEVYRAHDTRLQRDVALKILHPDPLAGGTPSATGGAARLLREARSVAALEHPNVITIHDVGEIAEPESLRGTPYIAMELIKGKSLRELINGPSAPLADRVAWLVGAAQGLAAAHKAGLVHRDVKPENIMVRDDGVVKVLDFGIAKRSQPTSLVDPTSSTEAQLLPVLSTQGIVVGTPYYMAPEQLRNEVLDGRADQFSWGVVAYELLAGKPPWTTETNALQLVSEILSLRPAPPSLLNPEVPHHLDAIVLRALAKAREERFDTVAALVQELAPPAPSIRSVPPPQTSPFARTESFFSGPPSGPVSGAGAPASTSPAVGSAVGRGSWARWGSGVAALLVIGVVAVTYRSRTEVRATSPGAVGVAARDAGLADDPAAGSKVPAAVSAYRAAMGAFRDADVDRGARELEAAIAADPGFAAAHLRCVLAVLPPDEEGREHLRQATRLHASLDAHDQILLNAMTPLSSAPGDLAESERRMVEAVAKSPDDADFAFQLCQVRGALGRADTIETCRRASELDPGAAMPLQVLAIAQVRANDVRGALASYNACLRNFPLATSCIAPLCQLQALEGDCEAAIGSARRLVAADPESPYAYDELAEVLLGAGEPIEGVRAALAEKLSRLPPSDVALAKTKDDALVAMRTGAFALADAQLRAWEAAVASSSSMAEHDAVAVNRVMLALEQGRYADVKALATAHLARQSAWSGDSDQEIFFDGVLYRVGAITADELAKRRTKWLEAKKAQALPSQLGYLWITGFAEPAVTAEDARAALDALPGYLPLPSAIARTPDLELPIAKAYHLAGRDAEALPHFMRAVKACVGREAPLEQTWASLSLGETLEEMGDTAGACQAYGVVWTRWKNAPASVSARRAGLRMKALGCSR